MNVISRGLWPPFLADLYPCNQILLVKCETDSNNPCTKDELKESIQSVVLSSISTASVCDKKCVMLYTCM